MDYHNGHFNFSFNLYETGLKARLYRPAQITIDHSGNLYVADSGNQRIRKIVLQLNATS